MSKLCPMFSGSEGNATLISSDNTDILVDAGVSFKRLREALPLYGSSIESIKGIFITHEHSDHIAALRTLLKSVSVPIYGSEQTLTALIKQGIIPAAVRLVPISDSVEIEGIKVTRFATSHDCEGSSGYRIDTPFDTGACVCTDLGFVSDEVRSALRGCDAVLIESNHDINMLQKGPYPPALKMRILSECGHLSNNACALELPELLNCGTKQIILGHLSRQNNNPLLALSAAKSMLKTVGAAENRDYILTDARPSDNGVTVF